MERTEHLEDKPRSSLAGGKRGLVSQCPPHTSESVTDYNTQVRHERPASVLGAQVSSVLLTPRVRKCAPPPPPKKENVPKHQYLSGIWKTEPVQEKSKPSPVKHRGGAQTSPTCQEEAGSPGGRGARRAEGGATARSLAQHSSVPSSAWSAPNALMFASERVNRNSCTCPVLNESSKSNGNRRIQNHFHACRSTCALLSEGHASEAVSIPAMGPGHRARPRPGNLGTECLEHSLTDH